MANPWTIASTATRHMLDASVGFGIPSDRYNARDQYRRKYSADERNGAGIGTALAVAVPVAAGAAWMQRGLRVPGLTGATDAVARVAGGNVARAAGLAALGAMTAVGVKKSIEVAQDDGNLGGAGTAVGMLGGAAAGIALGNKFAGRYAPLVTGAAAIAGGIAGHFGGKAIKVGEGHIGEELKQEPQVDEDAGDRVRSFTRGAFDHFTEVGPSTQGISFGYRWGMRETVQQKYSNAERAGGMHGDLLAAGILGGGALAVGAGLMGMSSHAAQGVSGLRAGADIAGNVLARGPLTGAVQKLSGKGAIGVGAAAAGITALATWKGFEADRDSMGTGAAAAIAAGTVAATAGTAALISRSGAMKTLAAAPRAANSALVAAALIGVVSAARLPLQQFMNDAKDAHAANGGVDLPVAATAAGVGAVGGGLGAFKGLSKFVPSGGIQLGKFHIPKGVIVGAGTAVSAAALGGVGFGLSATMPDIKKVGISVAGGAAAGAAAGVALRGVGVVPGIIGGAALGLSASALLNDEQPAKDETTPQEVAGTVGG
jgi:hypothetical protein